MEKIKFGSFLLFMAFVGMVFVSSCSETNTGTVDLTALNASISEAETLIATTEEGPDAGQYPPGSQDLLQEAIDLAQAVVDDKEVNQVEVNLTNIALQVAIDTYKNSVN